MHLRPALLILFLACFIAQAQDIKDGQFPVASNLKAGVAKIDITPPDITNIKIVGHVR